MSRFSTYAKSNPLTKEKQDRYFDNVVAKLFDQEQSKQLLFSFLKNDQCIGYGGLVLINWLDKHAAISFTMSSVLGEQFFEMNWSASLKLLEKIIFSYLGLHKLFFYSFDLRPHLYTILERNKYFLEVRLKEHCFFNGQFKDVVIYAKLTN
jgi:RimJ/RimL family protein N-acetyltransferase